MKTSVFALIVLLSITGCTTTQKGTVTGAVAGGALGGIIGHQSGRGGTGAAIGAAAGALTGAVVSENMAKKFCPVCGADYFSDTKFCPKDGSELKDKQ